MHEAAFLDSNHALKEIRQAIQSIGDWPWYHCTISADELPLQDAVKSYLFNSQLLTRPDGNMTLLCPLDARETKTAFEATQKIISESNPVDDVQFLDLRQSMNNGGGPACLRLRVVLDEQQQQAVHPGIVFNAQLYEGLKGWVNQHYRNELAPDDLRDPTLIDEVNSAYEDLVRILDLPPSVFNL